MTQTVTREITKYTVSYFGGGKKTAMPYPYRAIVGLYDNAGIIAALYFHNDPNTIPSGDALPDTGQPMSHYPVEDFPRVMDLLRNEKPIYYQQVAGWPYMSWLSTTPEAVGEGEPG